MMLKAGIIVVSDTRGRGGKEDKCIPAISSFWESKGGVVTRTGFCLDEVEEIRQLIMEFAGADDIDVVITSGGTGVSPRDVTPEATRPLLEIEIPGIPEAMRATSFKKTVRAVISRGVAGLVKGRLVINLPGSPKAAIENLDVVYDAFEHLLEKARGDASDCGI